MHEAPAADHSQCIMASCHDELARPYARLHRLAYHRRMDNRNISPHPRAGDNLVRRDVGLDSALGQCGDWTQPLFSPSSWLCRLRVPACPRICSCTGG